MACLDPWECKQGAERHDPCHRDQPACQTGRADTVAVQPCVQRALSNRGYLHVRHRCACLFGQSVAYLRRCAPCLCCEAASRTCSGAALRRGFHRLQPRLKGAGAWGNVDKAVQHGWTGVGSCSCAQLGATSTTCVAAVMAGGGGKAKLQSGGAGLPTLDIHRFCRNR